jgi:hypothetical protein
VDHRGLRRGLRLRAPPGGRDADPAARRDRRDLARPGRRGRTQSCAGGTEVYVRKTRACASAACASRTGSTAWSTSTATSCSGTGTSSSAPRPARRRRLPAARHRAGPMAEPFDAFVMRYANPEEPTVALSADRSVLDVSFRRIPPNDGVEIRYLMDPALFDERGERAGLEALLRDQLRVVRDDDRDALLARPAQPPGLGAAPRRGRRVPRDGHPRRVPARRARTAPSRRCATPSNRRATWCRPPSPR